MKARPWQKVVTDGGELGEDLGHHPVLALAREHPDQRRHPRVEVFVLRWSRPPVRHEGARVACGPAQRARARARVRQRRGVTRGGAGGGAGRRRARG